MSNCAATPNPAPASRLRLSGMMTPARDPACDRLTQLAATILRTKIALISFIDRDVLLLKSCSGLPGADHVGRERPLSRSLSRFVVKDRAPVAIQDVRNDPRTRGDAELLEFNVLACLGVPLLAGQNQVIGALWVMDEATREWTAEEVTILEGLAVTVLSEVQLRQEVQSHQRAAQELAVAQVHQLQHGGHHTTGAPDDQGVEPHLEQRPGLGHRPG